MDKLTDERSETRALFHVWLDRGLRDNLFNEASALRVPASQLARVALAAGLRQLQQPAAREVIRG